MSKPYLLPALAIAAVVLLIPLWGQTADEILTKSENQIKGSSSYSIYIMRVITPDFTRELKMESWWTENDDKALITMIAPKREAGNKTLKIGNEIWMYLRNTETTIKIPPSMMLQSWNGSDYTYDDLVRESNLKTDYAVSLSGQETKGNEMCWKLELIPNPDAPVVWGKIHYWVRQTDYLPAEVRYYDEKGKSIRTQIFKEHKVLGNRKLPSVWIMKNELKPGHQTEMILETVEFDKAIPDKVFSFQALER